MAVEVDLAARDHQAAPGMPEKCQRDSGFARARFSHEAEHLPGADGDGDLANNICAARNEVDLKVTHCETYRRSCRRGS